MISPIRSDNTNPSYTDYLFKNYENELKILSLTSRCVIYGLFANTDSHIHEQIGELVI